MAVGLIMLISGKLVVEYYSMRLSFIIFTSGLLLLLGGWGIVRRLAFPLWLLVLMLPLPSIITSTLTLPLQLVSSRLAAGILQAVGYPLVLEGNVIDLGVRQLQVVAACSGLRYILSLLALAVIFCYFYQRRFWKAAILLTSLVPIAILANALRVAAMGIYPALQAGFWHGFSGWLIFLFCLSTLALINYCLNYLKAGCASNTTESLSVSGGETAIRKQTSNRPYLIAALVMLIISASLVYTVAQPPRVPLLQSFDNFPLQLGPWQGHRTYMDQKIFAKTDADSYFDADFTCAGGAPISLYIAYYETQTSPGGLGHNPGVCMTGSGWQTLKSGVNHISPTLLVNYLVLEREGTPLLIYYWNIHQGQWLALSSARMYKIHTAYNALWHQRTDWALVRLITVVDNNLEAAKERLNSFAQTLEPILPKFIKYSN